MRDEVLSETGNMGAGGRRGTRATGKFSLTKTWLCLSPSSAGSPQDKDELTERIPSLDQQTLRVGQIPAPDLAPALWGTLIFLSWSSGWEVRGGGGRGDQISCLPVMFLYTLSLGHRVSDGEAFGLIKLTARSTSTPSSSSSPMLMFGHLPKCTGKCVCLIYIYMYVCVIIYTYMHIYSCSGVEPSVSYVLSAQPWAMPQALCHLFCYFVSFLITYPWTLVCSK